MSDFSFRWLHISDLHFGMREQAPQWSNLKHHLYDDLPVLFSQSGPWDVIIFSGDIVQKGSDDEFTGATDALIELYEKLRSLGCEPKFMAVPGNHDLVRPPKNDMPAMLLKDWQSKPTVREEFLNDPASSYRDTIRLSLENYQIWYKKLPDAGIPVVDAACGFLPGDQAARFSIGERQVGIVGLNSTWLQLSNETVAGDLHVDHLQLSAMLPEAEEWCRSNQFNILVTHHPVEWLHPTSHETWKREVAPPGRFDVHLFGHMHEPSTSSLSIMGSTPIVSFQSPSLFGCEFLRDGSTKRINGYSAGALTLNGAARELRMWPRIYKVNRSGQGKMVPDQDFHLGDNISVVLSLSGKATAQTTNSINTSPAADKNEESAIEMFVATNRNQPQGLLARFRYHLLPAGPHAHVRKVEQDTACAALNSRALWIVSDWGLSSDKFVSSILESASLSEASIFRLDLSDIPLSGSDLALEIEGKLGLKVQELSEELARAKAVLLLDDVILGERSLGALPREQELEQLGQVILDYCPSLVILMRTRSSPVNDRFNKVELAALDEADLKAYIHWHQDGGEGLSDPTVVNQIFSRTGGVPDQVDRALKALKVVTLSELVASRDEVVDLANATDFQPLIRVIDELGSAGQTNLKRALEMLRVLATFPHGAQFEHIKRFNGVHGFYADNATELMQRSLITAATSPGLEQSSLVESRRILSVPRTVRDVVRSQMSPTSLDRHDRRAAELYFGVDWRTGSKNWPAGRKYSSGKCPHHEIANASDILNRLLRAALEKGNNQEISALMRLAATYSDALDTGSHYYSVVSFCSVFLHTVPAELDEGIISRIRAKYANALRMIGERSLAVEIMESIDHSTLDRSDRERMLMNLARAYESEGDNRAFDVAKEIYKTTKSAALKLQARGIILTSEPPGPERRAKLVALQREARNKKLFVTANNIAISLAVDSPNLEEASQYLRLVISSKKDAENVYNEARAVVSLVERLSENGEKIPNFEHSLLMQAYQYLFIQRISPLFDRCHKMLWRSFVQRGEINNLYALFRHSSFIWRIRGKISAEQKYINSLASVSPSVSVDSRDRDYFNARIQAMERPQKAIPG